MSVISVRSLLIRRVRSISAVVSVLILPACSSPQIPSTDGVVASAQIAQAHQLKPPTTVINSHDQQILDQLLENMVVIPAGSFAMGDSQQVGERDELPVHQVQVDSFSMGRFEVTFEQYDLFARMTGSELIRDRWGRGQRPIIDVSWLDAMEFINWINQTMGVTLRLPTEAEWEYAARAGSAGSYNFGNNEAMICDYANTADNSTTIGWRTKKCSDGFKTTAPVGSFKPNAFGLYDMHGNVWEWLGDCWFRNYNNAPDTARPRLKFGGCSKRVQRGGAWFYSPDEARSSYRSQGDELDKSVTLGFRLAADI